LRKAGSFCPHQQLRYSTPSLEDGSK